MNAQAGSNDDAARHGDVLIWTIREPDPAAILAEPALLDGKIVVNLNNRDYGNAVQHGAWFGEAIAEQLQRHAPKARVVKALNLVAMETLDTTPELLRAAGAQLFVAGMDRSAKTVVSQLLAELGFDAIDLGEQAVAMRAVEALGDVIRLLMIGQKRGANINLQLRPLPTPDLQTVGHRSASNYT
jgi:predicted dinucleotide-binding enzyme